MLGGIPYYIQLLPNTAHFTRYEAFRGCNCVVSMVKAMGCFMSGETA